MAFGKKELTQVINDALHKIGANDISFSLEQPQELSHGDYATNVALIACKKLNISSKECAEKIKGELGSKYKEITRIEIAGPGFINFFLGDEMVRDINKQKIEKLETKYTGKNILVEHSSPNLFKPFHIGHLMNNIVGEFVSRAIQEGGANVTTMSFPSDVSLGIAKAVYIIREDIAQGKDIFKEYDEDTIVAYFGECYRKGVTLHEENQELEGKVKELSAHLFEQIESGTSESSEAYDIYTKAHSINTAYFNHVIESLGSHIDKNIFESEAGVVGRRIVLDNTPKVFTKSDGAVVYIPDEARKDLNASVFINSEGHPTYEAKDLGLIQKKFTEHGLVDYSYFITDSQQTHHFRIVLDAGSKINDEWKVWTEKSVHIPHGRMLFKGQKMSSRLGGVPLALDVVSVVEEEVRERAGEKIAHLSIEDKKKLEREIALSALRIAVLRAKPGLNINFDPESSLSFEGDSGPYLLYTHARCASLIEKGNLEPKFGLYEVTPLERNMVHAEELFVKAIEDLAPQQFVTYLFSIAQLFNSWYAQEQLITDDKEKTAHNLAVVARVKNILGRGLYILGIEAPNKM